VELLHHIIIYRVIQKDGLNFVRLCFMNYTWHVNDLLVHNIWKRRSKIFKYHRYSASVAHTRAAASVESKMATMQPRITFSSDTRGRPELLPLHRQPICSNWWFQLQMLFLVGGWMLKRRRNARCTAVADSVLMNSRTQKILCCLVAILLSTDAAARLCARRAL